MSKLIKVINITQNILILLSEDKTNVITEFLEKLGCTKYYRV